MLPVKVKDHTTISQSRHRGGVAVQLYPCLVWALDGSEKDPVSIVPHEAGWPPGLIWMGMERRDFKPRTIQPMVSHYTNYAIPVSHCSVNSKTANVCTTFRHVHATTVSVEKH